MPVLPIAQPARIDDGQLLVGDGILGRAPDCRGARQRRLDGERAVELESPEAVLQ